MKFLVFTLLLMLVGFGEINAQDRVTSLKTNVFPATKKIRPLETAIIQTQFFGEKKKDNSDETQNGQIQSNDWKATLNNTDNGWLSKAFLFQKPGENIKPDLDNFLRRS